MNNTINKGDIVAFGAKTPRYGTLRTFLGTVIGVTEMGSVLVRFPEAYCFGSETGTMYIPITDVIAKVDANGPKYRIGKWFEGHCSLLNEYTGQIPVVSF